ncbi:MAG: hypothetical protein HY900_23050 [Deltaproteobacteria bacterium]|nr:hypothetical protein [Deltaproteobacteria bacterium]
MPRARFDEWVTAASDAKLVLVRAPAGFGKTTLMLQWMRRLREEGVATCWLSLSEADNDVGRFVSYLSAALRQIDPTLDLGESGFAFGGETATAGLLNLLEWVSTREAPFALFLDELELVQNGAVHEILEQLLRNLPERCLLLVATRQTPRLGIGRLRARGQLVDIGLEDLRFSPEESAKFLDKTGNLDLDEEDLSRLQQCTEGWIAGLQLAALALSGREDGKAFIRSLTGSHADIADYLAEDVLARQPEDVREFLLKTSILERLSGPLCDAVTGRSDGYEMLAELERANLFLVPLDDERHWYRYHNLFAQFLRSRLERGFRDRVVALHRSAAAWLAGAGIPVGAATHLLAAGDADEAASVMASCAFDLLKLGRVRTVSEWAERLPPEALDRHPYLRLAYCWVLCANRRYHEAIANLDALSAPAQLERLEPLSREELLAVRPTVLLFEGRLEECHQAALENLPKTTAFGSFGYGVLRNVLAFCFVTTARFEEADALLRHALLSHEKAGTMYATVYAKCFQGWSQMVQGNLREGMQEYRMALACAREASPGYSVPGAVAATFLAEALYESNQLQAAERLLSDHLALIPEGSTADVVLLAYVTLARIRSVRGDGSEALRLLEEAESAGRERGVARFIATVHLERIRLALQQGDVAEAERLSKSRDDRELWTAQKGRCMPANDPETYAVNRLRLLIRRGGASSALPALSSELARVTELHRARQALKLRILTSEALAASGEKRAALRVLSEAVSLAAPAGWMRLFLDEGPATPTLLHELRKQVSEEGAAGETAEFLDRLLTGLPARGPTPAAEEEPEGAAEDLTDKEVKILEMLSRGLTNQSLAEHFFVSVATVKFHLRNINLKLGAHNRTEAIAKARKLGFLG